MYFFYFVTLLRLLYIYMSVMYIPPTTRLTIAICGQVWYFVIIIIWIQNTTMQLVKLNIDTCREKKRKKKKAKHKLHMIKVKKVELTGS